MSSLTNIYINYLTNGISNNTTSQLKRFKPGSSLPALNLDS